MKTKILSIVITVAAIIGLSGCAHAPANATPEQLAAVHAQNLARLSNAANFAAYAGTVETLKYLPTKREGFERAVADLKTLEAGPIDVIALGQIIQRLDVKELKSTEAKLIISGIQIAVVTELGTTPLDKVQNLLPIVTAIRSGIERGLEDSQ